MDPDWFWIFESQLIPGHEGIDTIAAAGKNVKGFSEGDRCVADPGVTVRHFPGLTESHLQYATLVQTMLLLSTWTVPSLRELQWPRSHDGWRLR